MARKQNMALFQPANDASHRIGGAKTFPIFILAPPATNVKRRLRKYNIYLRGIGLLRMPARNNLVMEAEKTPLGVQYGTAIGKK
jgi:hypothetical protein